MFSVLSYSFFVFLFFFFFKQKTAYEMRISDWSSDVCSSDLIAPLEPNARAVAVGNAHILKDDALDPRAIAAQHERGLALAGHAVEDRAAGLGGDEGDASRGLHRAVAVMAGGDAGRPFALTDRLDRILQTRKAAPVHAVRRAAPLRGARHRPQ